MPNLNKIFLMGHVGRDPEFKPTSSGKGRATFSLAVKTGKDQTTWFNCQSWDKLADLAIQLIKKGTSLYIEGQMSSFKSNQDDSKMIWVVNVGQFQLLEKKKDGGNFTPSAESVPDGFSYSDDDLPF